jgi:hypothetical protein
MIKNYAKQITNSFGALEAGPEMDPKDFELEEEK